MTDIKSQKTGSIWKDIPDEHWNSWHWQMSNRLSTLADFEKIINLSQEERRGLQEFGVFRVHVTPYFSSLIDPENPSCPIRKQVIPIESEFSHFESEMLDPLSEDQHSPVPGLFHRHADRAGLMVTTECASYCRFCTRSRVVGNPRDAEGKALLDEPINYIRAHKEIRDVLLSGGDALIVSTKYLREIITKVRSIPHVEIIRISTRVPIFLPQRIDEDLVKLLREFQPLWININCNHPKEITKEVAIALAKLANSGIPLGSQSVLMQGINDCPNLMKSLMHKLLMNRVRPYYLYQCDLVQGAGHFRTPVSKGIEIIESLIGHTTGFGVPTFVIDMPHGGGKVPIMPNYIMSMSDSRIVVRNYEGFMSVYTQPNNYVPHDSDLCDYCMHSQGNKQLGVSGLLSGKKEYLKPEDWDEDHMLK